MLDIDSDPYSMFIFAMNAPLTREKYLTRLKRFFDFLSLPGSTMQERCSYFVEKSKSKASERWLLNGLLNFLHFYKERVQ